jgi:hypothetical protein
MSMRNALGVLSSMLMLECGMPDARAAPAEDEPAEPRFVLARMSAPNLGGAVPPPPLQPLDCNRQRFEDCVRFCIGQYSPAASKRCIRACNQYCRSCPTDRRRSCQAH